MSSGTEEDVVYKEGVVYLHQFSRKIGRQTVNISPFAVKLETWMRLNKIPYEVEDSTSEKSPTRQIPYIVYNGVTLADSGLIIDHLMQEFKIDPTEGLTSQQQGIGRAITQMTEESMSWTVFHFRYVQNIDEYCRFMQVSPSPEGVKQFKAVISDYVGKRANAQGLGRKTPEDIAKIAKRDMTALSQCLGEKPFFLGDRPTVVDCSVFGMLSQIVPVDMPYPHKAVLTSEAGGSNLVAFMERMKQAAWPDWDKLVNNEPFPV